MQTLPPVVLLDLDDTILDDSGAAQEAWVGAIAQEGDRLTVDERALLVDAIDRARIWFWSDPDRHRVGRADIVAARAMIVETAFAEIGRADAPMALRIARVHSERRTASIAPYEGAIEVLDRLVASGRTLGLITNGAAAAQRAKIDRFSLAPYFSYIGVEGEAGVGKPEPEAYRLAMAAIGFAPSEACMIGDNHEWDVAAPLRLGIAGIWVDRHGRGLRPGALEPTLTIRELRELPLP